MILLLLSIVENGLCDNALFKKNIENLLKYDQTFSSKYHFTSSLVIYIISIKTHNHLLFIIAVVVIVTWKSQ